MSNTESVTQSPTVFDENQIQVARVYSDALIQVALKKGQLENAVDEVDGISQFFRTNPGYLIYLTEAAKSSDESDSIIVKAFSGNVSDVVLNLLRILNQKDRLNTIHCLAERLKLDSDGLLGRCRVHVTVASELDPDSKSKLEQNLQSRLGLTPIIEYSLDASLIGGLVIRIGDLQFDSS
ncbi:MAG: synthase subunit delta, partial [Planctomycetota bacterium]